MQQIWIYSLTSVVIVSLLSIIGIFTLSIKTSLLKRVVIYMVSFSAGALLGDAFMHLLPETIAENGFTINTSIYILTGIVVSFVLEKVIHWHHCHEPECDEKEHAFAYMNLLGDGIHNFIDGLIIGASYMISIPVGVATTIAVILHEIPQEIGDFGVLIHGGFSKLKALLLNFLTALSAIIGAVVAIVLGSQAEEATLFLVPFAIGAFIYIAAADLIPELHKETKIGKSVIQLVWFILGIGLMMLLLLVEFPGHEHGIDKPHAEETYEIHEQVHNN